MSLVVGGACCARGALQRPVELVQGADGLIDGAALPSDLASARFLPAEPVPTSGSSSTAGKKEKFRSDKKRDERDQV